MIVMIIITITSSSNLSNAKILNWFVLLTRVHINIKGNSNRKIVVSVFHIKCSQNHKFKSVVRTESVKIVWFLTKKLFTKNNSFKFFENESGESRTPVSFEISNKATEKLRFMRQEIKIWNNYTSKLRVEFYKDTGAAKCSSRQICIMVKA